MNEKATDDYSAIKGLWPIFLIAVVLLFVAGGCFYFAIKIWIVITLLCLGLAFLCYGCVFCFCPPQPLLIKSEPSPEQLEPKAIPFSISHIPIMVGGMLLMALMSPWLLMLALLFYVRVRFQWRRQFPKSSKTEIQDFLNGLARSLGFESASPRFISPNDKLKTVYESIYGPRDTPDTVEIDKVDRHLREQYGIDFKTLWREDVTIGELYAHAKHILL